MTIAPGLCSITCRALSADEVLGLSVRAGVEGIEWGADGHVPPGGGIGVETLAARCRDAGVEIASYGSYLGFGPPEGDQAVDGIEAVLDSAQALGAPMIRIWTELGVTPESPADERRRVTARTAALVDAIGARGLMAALEFHPGTLTHTAQSTNQILDTLDRANVKTHWQHDPSLLPVEAVAELERVRDRLAHVHVFTWGPAGIGERNPLADGAELWESALSVAREAPPLPVRRYALCEYVRGDDAEQLVADVATLRRWIDSLTITRDWSCRGDS